MQFRLQHPDYPQYGFDLLQITKKADATIERLGPVKIVSGAFDWPHQFGQFRNWTDRLNSLWWPPDAESFSTCVLAIDDARNDLLTQCIELQRAATPRYDWRWPYMILTCYLSPPEGLQPDGRYAYAGESFPPAGVPPVVVKTVFMEWKLYPLTPVNLTSTLPGEDSLRGLWLLPLVDIRYFYRNVPLNDVTSGSSSSGAAALSTYPLITVDNSQEPSWMPPVRGYPTDAAIPANFVPISGNGTHREINASTRFGIAADLQAKMNNWRIVNRDVRTNYNVPPGGTPHNQFTGVISDYPEDWSVVGVESYHTDALNLVDEFQNRIAGGDADARTLDDLIARKIQVLFSVAGTDTFYSITVASSIDYPLTVGDLTVDEDGPNAEEAKIIPSAVLGVQVSTRYPGVAEKDSLVTAAKQWVLLYFAWRHRQGYIRLPGIQPLIPNGHAQMIRWDFQPKQFWTTYIAIEGVQGTDDGFAAVREPFYATIDGEGSINDGLHGVYAWTSLLDTGGALVTDPNPRKGYVAGVNGQGTTINPARDETGKVAVPVQLIVWLKPGKPYLDATTGQIFDHYLFTTTDLLQIIKLKTPLERNSYGHFAGIVQRWNPDTKTLVDSENVWTIVLP